MGGEKQQQQLTDIEIILIDTWEGLGLGGQGVAAFVATGECRECEQLVLL